MNYTMIPSLKHISLIKIACTLWNREDFRNSISKFDFSSPILNDCQIKREWQKIKDIVIKEMLKFHLLELLIKKLSSCIDAVGWQILKWLESHKIILGMEYAKKNVNQLCWTPQGTVDKKKTAEILVKDLNLDIARRYRLACIYCLEENIREEWNKMPDNYREFFYREAGSCNVWHPLQFWLQKLVAFWTYNMIEEFNKLEERKPRVSFLEAFQSAALSGCKVSAEYFLQKLTPLERGETVVKYARFTVKKRCSHVTNRILSFSCRHANQNVEYLASDSFTDVSWFLLSQMDNEQQIELFESSSRDVLQCLLDWPWQKFFMETANRLWDFLSHDDFHYLLEKVIHSVKSGYMECKYKKVFKKFWIQSPNSYKRYIMSSDICGSLLLELLETRDKDNFKLILKDATLTEKLDIILDETEICETLIYNQEWAFLEYFIQECISSKKMLIQFKDSMVEVETRGRKMKERQEEENNKWNRFFQLLNDFIHKDSKKRNVEGESSTAKRLHSI